jgi:hypothetical protein
MTGHFGFLGAAMEERFFTFAMNEREVAYN